MDEKPRAHRTDYVRLVRRAAVTRWRLILGVFVVVALPAVVWATALVPKTYEAKASIFIEDTTNKGGAAALVRDWMPQSDMPFQLAILRSRSLAEAVLQNMPPDGMDELLQRAMHRDYVLDVQNAILRLLGREVVVYTPRQRALADLQAARTRFIPLASGEVEIRTVAYQPRAAMDLANTYVKVLQDRTRSNAQAEARATREFIENLLKQTKTALQESEEGLGKFQQGRGTIRLNERSELEARKLAQMENSLADVQASKEIAKAQLNFLKGGRDATGKLASAAGHLQPLRERLTQLQDKLAALQEKYTDQHPLVVATQSEIKDVQANIDAMLKGPPGTGPAAGQAAPAAIGRGGGVAKQIAELEAEIAALEAKEQVLKQRVETFSRTLSNLSAEEMESSKLVRAVETQRNLHNLLAEKLSAARIQEQGEVRGMRVIDFATLPMAPSNSPVIKKILMGLALGLGLGLGLAVLVEHSNQPVETVDDVAEVSDLPVLGWLPNVETGHAPDSREASRLGSIGAANADPLLVEACRGIRTSLESLTQRRSLHTVMVASAGPGEGKSTVLLNLASVFSELGRRVVVVDSDLRRPTLHRTLRCPARAGLADLLAGRVSGEDVMRTIQENVLFLPAGSVKGTNPGALLSGERIRRFLDFVGDSADLVLFDSAPVLAVPDNVILASMVDGVILVVRAGQTQQRDLLRVTDRLEKTGAVMLGAVVNRLSPRQTRSYYATYGSYYGLAPQRRSTSWFARLAKRNGKES